MNLNFNKVWASDTSPDYPSDTQAKRGLSFLGTEPPTFDLHDAIFQRLDSKALWLYDQVRVACERFGQKVQNDDGSLVSDARDTMANAITYALLNQRKADEGGYGIVRMANADQTNAGQEYNLAVSPKHLAEYVSAQNTWESTKNKPQTATRWPDYSEVSNKPTFGSAAWRNENDFDEKGSADEVKKWADTFFSKLGTAAYGNVQTNVGVWNQNYGTTTLAKEETIAYIRDWANSFFVNLRASAGQGVYHGKDKAIGDFVADSSLNPDMDALVVLRDALSKEINKKQNASDLKAAAFCAVQTSEDIWSQKHETSNVASEGALASVVDWANGKFEDLGPASTLGVHTFTNVETFYDTDKYLPTLGALNGLYQYCKGIGTFVDAGNESGYTKLPGGLIIQIAKGEYATGESRQVINFPISFPNYCVGALVSTRTSVEGSSGDAFYQTSGWDKSWCSVWRQVVGGSTSSDSSSPYVIAIGY